LVACAGAALLPLGMLRRHELQSFDAAVDWRQLAGGCTVLTVAYSGAVSVERDWPAASICADRYTYTFTTTVNSNPLWRPPSGVGRWKPYGTGPVDLKPRTGGSSCPPDGVDGAPLAPAEVPYAEAAPATYRVNQNISCWLPRDGSPGWASRPAELAGHYACAQPPAGACGIQLFDPAATHASAVASAQSRFDLGRILLAAGLPSFAFFALCLNRLCTCLFGRRAGKIYVMEDGHARVPSPSPFDQAPAAAGAAAGDL
jgi:hypothetical protein